MAYRHPELVQRYTIHRKVDHQTGETWYAIHNEKTGKIDFGTETLAEARAFVQHMPAYPGLFMRNYVRNMQAEMALDVFLDRKEFAGRHA